MAETWRERLARGRVLLDGGLGASLIATGRVPTTGVADATLDAPELVLDAHRGFLAAGAEALFTNTFGANRPALAGGPHAARWRELNVAAVELARRAADEHGGAYVLGDLGPVGFWSRAEVEPPLPGRAPVAAPVASLADSYREQAAALVEAGVDGLVVETLPGAAEGRVALAALREVSDLPVTVCVTTTRRASGITTLAGEPAAEALASLAAAGADAVGLNCGEGSEALLEALTGCLAAVDVPLVAKPNAGLPTAGEDGPVHGQAPEAFAADLARALLLGAAAVGGCCGADARFIAALRACFGDR